MFANAVRRMAIQENGKALRKVVETLFSSAGEGDVQAIKEIADRLDGKPAQAIVGADGGPLEVVQVPWVQDRSR